MPVSCISKHVNLQLSYGVTQKVKTQRFVIVTHVLLNSIIKLSRKLYNVSNKMFNVSAISCRQEFQFSI